MRLRQVALVVNDLDQTVATICRELSVEVAFRDPSVGVFGLHNAVIAIGDDNFLEVVSPLTPDCSAARYLARRGRDSGYMVILQSDDLEKDRRRLERFGVTVVWEVALEDISTIHLHPRDLGGAIVSLDQPRPAQSWRWAGPRWQETINREVVDAIVAVEIGVGNPVAVAQRWATVLGLEAHGCGARRSEVTLENATLRFTPGRDGDEDAIVALDLRSASRRGGQLEAGGTLFRFV